MGQGMPLSNITAAVNFVRATWPTAILAYNEDFNVIASGFTGLNESVSADPELDTAGRARLLQRRLLL